VAYQPISDRTTALNSSQRRSEIGSKLSGPRRPISSQGPPLVHVNMHCRAAHGEMDTVKVLTAECGPLAHALHVLPGNRRVTQRRDILRTTRSPDYHRTLEETRQHQTTPQCFGLSPACAGSHHSDGPKASHALTFKLDHSSGAVQRFITALLKTNTTQDIPKTVQVKFRKKLSRPQFHKFMTEHLNRPGSVGDHQLK